MLTICHNFLLFEAMVLVLAVEACICTALMTYISLTFDPKKKKKKRFPSIFLFLFFC